MRLIETIRDIAPYWWTATSVFGLFVCGYMVKAIRKAYPVGKAIHRDPDLLTTLRFMVRLVGTTATLLFLMGVAGVLSLVFPIPNIPVALVTYAILLSLPPALTWIIYRAIRLRVQ